MGTGISSLYDAFALQEAGFRVAVYTKDADPRLDHKVNQYSSTRGGELGRFVSRFEGEQYLGSSPMYPDMKAAFQAHVTDGGWLGKTQMELTQFDHMWLRRRLACDDQSTIDQTERFYITANGVAMSLWQECIVQFPHLFEQADVQNTGLLRLYDNATQLQWAVRRHAAVGVLEQVLLPAEVANRYPYFSEAATCGYLAGGLEAPGFSFNVHRFTDNLITYLERQGVLFQWSHEIAHIQFSKTGLVAGLVLATSELITADYYTLNPGAYADEQMFAGTGLENTIAGVAGRWLIIPSPPHFKRPVKIHGDVRTEQGRRFPVVDINLTHYTDITGHEWLAVGGGYVYVGKSPFAIQPAVYDFIDAENERTVKRFLGPTYDAAQQAGLIRKSQATCVRSFTYNDQPAMANLPTLSGGVLRINAGTNTGTTTIAPYTARETVRAFTAHA